MGKERIDDLREKALDGMMLEKAYDDMGIYPKAATGGENPYTERTEYMEGWNAYGMELSKKWSAISRWMGELPADVKRDIEDFLLNENLYLNVRNDRVSLYVNCNDLFWWACADGEYFELSDLPEFKKAFEDSPENGGILWCCRKRGMRPQKPYYKYFNESEKTLFDAAGPERTDA